MHFYTFGRLAHRLSRELVGFQVEWQSVLIGHSGENDAHYVGNREAHFFEHSGGLVFHLSADPRANNGIRNHASVVAHLGYNANLLPAKCDPLYRS